MALLQTFFRSFLLFTSMASFNAMADDHNQTDQPPGIPELPPEEIKPAAAANASGEEPTNLVVNYDDARLASGFFTGTATRGSLNALDLSGYFRMRFSYFRNGHLGTYIPELKRGTSMMLPNLSLIGQKADDESSNNEAAPERNPAQNSFSGNMRLRIDPTINVSEVVRIKGTIDVFDNLVLGSTPAYLAQHGSPNPSWPSSLMSLSQNAPMPGVNSWQGALSLKRAWAEANFAIGEVKFGRMPLHFGLGILYNSGDDINGDYGDQVDGISFTTRVFDHFITPSYHIAYSGPSARGGGFFAYDKNYQSLYLATEAGQRYPLETADMTHVLSLSFLKRESDFMVNKKREEGRAIFDYGVFTSYRRQFLDTQTYAVDSVDIGEQVKKVVKRDSHVGLGSLWAALSYGTFHIEAEAAGIWGKYQIGEKETDLMAINDNGTSVGDRKIWLLQGGIALQSKYGFLNDRLQVGLDAGFASSQDGAGFGIREGSKKNPDSGDADGRKLPSGSGYKTNFKFNPAYTVDLLMYREVLGGISGTFYLKPHLAYFFSRNLGLRGDVITSLAPNKSNTTGNSNWLGVELDASAFLRSENGFYFQLAYGVLFPLKGLSHQAGGDIKQKLFETYGTARVAQTLQAFVGVTF